ncbi:MAG: hypothetical protein E6G60_09600 [Actinobacteria bacterium]|nr:MAG: hypothetical protein E6G60_09600 [Actinomycetota bacterium]
MSRHDAPDIEGALDELYEARPDEFLAVRSALERKFRDAGHREAASELHRRRRPNLAAWATNQIARRDAAGVNRLIDATRRIADSQSAAYAGASGEDLRRAARQRQDLLDQLADLGVKLLSGLAPSPSGHRDDIRATLDAGSLDEEVAGELRAGRLSRSLRAPVGFGGLGAVVESARGAPRTAARARSGAASAPIEPARRAATELAGAAEHAASEQARAEREARAAALRLREAEDAVAAARAAAREAEKRVREARTAATRAERAAEKAANQLARAESQDGE